MKLSAINTAYLDIISIQRFIMRINQSNSSNPHMFSILKDCCIILFEFNKAFLNESTFSNKNIKKIRNKVHLYSIKRGQNLKNFNKIIQSHVLAFDEDTNNIGFYINENNEIVGSTLATFYTLLDTDFLPTDSSSFSSTGEKMFQFSQELGQLTTIYLDFLHNQYCEHLHLIPKISNNISIIDNTQFLDLPHKLLFNSNERKNLFLFRLIISLDEISTVIWLHNTYKASLVDTDELDDYYILRILSLKVDEAIDNILNIQMHLKEPFNDWDESTNLQISELLNVYKTSFYEHCSKLRNMIHYDINEENHENFAAYIKNLQIHSPNFMTNYAKSIVTELLEPLKQHILTYINIDQYKPIPNWLIRLKRIQNLFTINN